MIEKLLGVVPRLVSLGRFASRKCGRRAPLCIALLTTLFAIGWFLPEIHAVCRMLWIGLPDGLPVDPGGIAFLSSRYMRYRKTNNVTTKSTACELWYYTKRSGCTAAANWAWYTTHNATENVGTAKEMWDVVTPNYHKLRRSGGVVFNPMEIRTLDQPASAGALNAQEYLPYVCSSPYQFREQWDWRTGNKVGSWAPNYWSSTTGITLPSSAIPESEVRRLTLLTATCAQNKRGRADANLYESLAEVHKTFGLLPAILGNGLKVLASKQGLLKRAKNAGSAWLAYRYGLAPVMSDISSVLSGLAKTAEKLRVRSKCEDSIQNTSVSSSFVVHDHCRFRLTTTIAQTVAVKSLSLDEWEMSRMELLGFTPKGLVTLPWELLPYSFVVDWFVNVGDLIGALVPAVGLNQLGSCVVRTDTWDVTTVIGDQEIDDPVNWRLLRPVTGSAYRRVQRKIRTPGLPTPSLIVRRNFRFNEGKRVLDALSLIVQRLK